MEPQVKQPKADKFTLTSSTDPYRFRDAVVAATPEQLREAAAALREESILLDQLATVREQRKADDLIEQLQVMRKKRW